MNTSWAKIEAVSNLGKPEITAVAIMSIEILSANTNFFKDPVKFPVTRDIKAIRVVTGTGALVSPCRTNTAAISRFS